MFVGNVQTIRKRVKNKQSKKKYKKNERKKIEWKSENSKKKNEKERVAKKRDGRGGSADIIFQLGDIRPERRFTELQRRRLLRFYSPEKDNSFFFVFFFLLATLLSFLRCFFLLLSICLLFLHHFFLLRTTRRQTSNVLFRYILASFSAYTLAYASSSEGFSFFPFFCALRTRKKRFRKEEENTRSCEGKRT